MKQPRIRIVPINKEDREKAKFVQEYMDWASPPKEMKRMMRQVILQEMAYRANPLGLIKVEWKDAK